MPKARKILERISAVGATKKITQAMKMVAVANLGKLKDRWAKEVPYIDGYLGLFQEVVACSKGFALPEAFVERPVKGVLLVCITTDKGLCGAFNQHILDCVMGEYGAHVKDGVRVDILPVGCKGLDFLQKGSYGCVGDYVCVDYSCAMEDIDRIARFASGSFEEGRYDVVKVIFQPSRMAAREKVRVQRLLPLSSGLVLGNGKEDLYTYEPSWRGVIDAMLPRVVGVELYRAWLLGSIAEESMRMLFTSQATDNAEKLIRGLRVSYNRVRQSSITRSLIEIMAGTDSMH